MELTKQQRHEIYKEALEIHRNLKKDEEKYLCLTLKEAFLIKSKKVKYASVYDEEFKNTFEEFYFFETKIGDHDVWWPYEDYTSKKVKEHQRTILEFCIEMTK